MGPERHTHHEGVDTRNQWTILSLIDWSTTYLETRGFDEARLHVELLLSHLLGIPRITLYTSFDRPLTQEELRTFKILFRRRLTHEPLQYIIGETEFMGMKFFVDRNVLIPRPETEVLVEKVIETLRELDMTNPSILDIGTGSGNVALALARAFPGAQVMAVDKSKDALQVAARNMSRHRITTVSLMEADVFSDFLPDRKFDLIASNPPYISGEEFAGLPPEIRDHEPRMATCDEGDGYRVLDRIAERARSMLNSGGFLFMEIGYSQSEHVLATLTHAGYVSVNLFNDYSGVPRVVRARQT